MNITEKIRQTVEYDTNGGCWLWRGWVSPEGYGKGYDPKIKRNKPAHRLSYESFVGPIPDGLVIDHLCRVRSCVNPAHLRVATNTENVMCGVGITAKNAVKTHCPKGHAYEGDNLLVFKGWRQCRICRHHQTQRRAEKLKAERHARGLQRKPHTNYPRVNKVSHLLEPTTPTRVDDA